MSNTSARAGFGTPRKTRRRGPSVVAASVAAALIALIGGLGLVAASGALERAVSLSGSLELIDASSDEVVMTVSENTATIAPASTPADGHGFRFVGAPPGTESMRFVISGSIDHRRIENVAPYSAFGNRGADHWGRNLAPGVYMIEVEAFSANRTRGTSLGSQTFVFEVLDGSPGPAPTPTSSPTPAPTQAPSSAPQTIVVSTTSPSTTATAAPTTPPTTPVPTTTTPPSATSTMPSDVHPDIVKVIDVVGRNPGGVGWMDSYSVDDRCYCATTFDHDIGDVEVDTPAGRKTVREVCQKIGDGPGFQDAPIYNDIQCGNGPANNAGDEDDCPGRVDIGRRGCGHIGPKWDLTVFD